MSERAKQIGVMAYPSDEEKVTALKAYLLTQIPKLSQNQSVSNSVSNGLIWRLGVQMLTRDKKTVEECIKMIEERDRRRKGR